MSLLWAYQILLTLLFIVLSAYIDHEHLKDNDYIEDHKSRWWLRATFTVAIGMLNWKDTLGCGLVFMSLFDTTLHFLRFKNFRLEFGNTATWDKFWSDRIITYYIFSAIALIIGVYLVYI